MSAVFAVLALALSAAANPFSERASDSVVHLPLTKISHAPSTDALRANVASSLPAVDRARAASLKKKTKTIPATEYMYYEYIVTVGVGSPPTEYTLLLDTGSSNTFVFVGTPWEPTKTTFPTGQNVSVVYGSGDMVGVEVLDQLTLADDFIIHNQSIANASDADGFYFDYYDGVLGVGPSGLTVGTLSPDVNATVPTVIQNAHTQGLISNEVLGVSLGPSNSNNTANGVLTFGGVDTSKYIGEINYVPITDTAPSNTYWGLNATEINFGSKQLINESHAGIVDTGTTLVLLADDFFQTYINALPNATTDFFSGLLLVPKTSLPYVQSLNFTIGGVVYELTADAQIISQESVGGWGGEEGKYYSIVSSLGTKSGNGLDFILGQTFLERFYSVLDTTNSRVGLAYTQDTYKVL